MHTPRVSIAPALLLAWVGLSNAHSWVEQMNVIDANGKYTGASGFPRGNIKRGPGFGDDDMVHLLPPNGRPQTSILPSDPMCMPSQQNPVQSADSPRLKAAPGASIALRYQENGHVTIPGGQKGKPDNRGTVYIYGTTEPKSDEKFLDIHQKWNREGTGGDKRGKLLSTQNFDDGRCYQVNGNSISVQRQQQFPHQADNLMGLNRWCQNNLMIPETAPSGKPYTLYWVWDWPTAPGQDPGLPNGKAEVYTTCIDVDITGNAKRAVDGAAVGDMDAIPSYLKQLASGTQPFVDAPAAAPAQAPSASQAAASVSPAPQTASPAPAPSAAAAPPASQAASPAPASSPCPHDSALQSALSALQAASAAPQPAPVGNPAPANGQPSSAVPASAPASVSAASPSFTVSGAPAVDPPATSSAASVAVGGPGAGVLNSAVPGYMSALGSSGQSTAAAPAPAGSQAAAPQASQQAPAPAQSPQSATQPTQAPSGQGLTFSTIPLAALKQAMPSQAPPAAHVYHRDNQGGVSSMIAWLSQHRPKTVTVGHRTRTTIYTNLPKKPTSAPKPKAAPKSNAAPKPKATPPKPAPKPAPTMETTTAPTPTTTPIPNPHSAIMPPDGSAAYSRARASHTSCFKSADNIIVCPGGFKSNHKRSEPTATVIAPADGKVEGKRVLGGSARFRFL